MTRVSVSADFAASSEDLWRLVADFGNVAWMPGMAELARVEGSGPGMIRFMPVGDKEIHEQLESVDAAARTLVYTIPVNVPFPVQHYRATMQVEDANGGSRLLWSCTCEPDGVAEAEVTAMVEGLYGMLIGWIRDHLGEGKGAG